MVVDTAVPMNELMEAAQQGDRDAFCSIYRLTVTDVYRYVSRRLHSVDDVEDVVQEVYLKALRRIGTFDARRGPVIGWLLMLARTTLADRGRSPVPTHAEWVDLPDRGDGPAERLAGGWGCEAVEALRRLSPVQQEVLMLRLVEDRTAEETAQIMGKTAVAVRVTQHRALRALRKHLSG